MSMPCMKWGWAVRLVAGAVLASTAIPAPAAAMIVYDTAREIYVADDDGANARRVANGASPHLSPDGRMLVYCAPNGSRLVATPLAGGDVRTVLTRRFFGDDGCSRHEIRFSRDSSRVLVAHQARGRTNIAWGRLTGPLAVLKTRGLLVDVALAPAGDRFALVKNTAAAIDLHLGEVFVARAGEPTRLVRLTRSVRTSSATWGRHRVLAAALSLTSRSHRSRIVAIAPRSGRRTALTRGTRSREYRFGGFVNGRSIALGERRNRSTARGGSFDYALRRFTWHGAVPAGVHELRLALDRTRALYLDTRDDVSQLIVRHLASGEERVLAAGVKSYDGTSLSSSLD